MSAEARVYVVDDEEDVRAGVALLLRSVGLAVTTYASGAELLAAVEPQVAGCLVLDVRLPEISGLELQEQLNLRGVRLPIVFISGHGDIPMAVRAVRAGALDFLEKPFSDQALLERVHRALELDRERRRSGAEQAAVEERLQRLTPRETEVLELLLEGKVNKLIARALDVSTRTVEIHRARILHKMEVENAQQLVRAVLSTGRYRSRG